MLSKSCETLAKNSGEIMDKIIQESYRNHAWLYARFQQETSRFLNISYMVHVRIMHATLHDLLKIIVEPYMIYQEPH